MVLGHTSFIQPTTSMQTSQILSNKPIPATRHFLADLQVIQMFSSIGLVRLRIWCPSPLQHQLKASEKTLCIYIYAFDRQFGNLTARGRF